MASTIILSDNGASSGSAGLKSTAGNDGVLILQTTTSGGTATTALTIDTTQNVGIGAISNGAKLLIYNAAATTNFTIQSDSTQTGGVFFNDGANSGAIQYLHASDAMTFRTASTEVMRIDSSGNVGIGTSSPTEKLQVVGRLLCTGGGYVTNPAGAIFGNYTGGAYPVAYIQAPASGGIDFWNAGTGQMGKFDTNGTFTVSGSYPNSYAAIFSNTSTTSGSVAINGNAATNSTATFIFYGTAAGANRFSAYGNGGLANYSANNVNLSDRREKTNFAPAKNYLETICSIPVQTFNYIDQDLENDGGLTLGVVAQDVEAVAPELVKETNWGTEDEPKMRLSIYQTDLQYALMKCIQEQQALITSLTERITALEAK